MDTYADDIKVYAEMTNGQRGVTVTGVQYAKKVSGNPEYKAGLTSDIKVTPNTESGITLLARYNGADAANSYVPTAVESRTINLVKDYVVGIMATGNVTAFQLDTDYSLTPEKPITTAPSNLKVQYVMASDEAGTASGDEINLNVETKDSEGYTINDQFSADDGYVAGMKKTITVVSIKNNSWTDTIEVTLAAAAGKTD